MSSKWLLHNTISEISSLQNKKLCLPPGRAGVCLLLVVGAATWVVADDVVDYPDDEHEEEQDFDYTEEGWRIHPQHRPAGSDYSDDGMDLKDEADLEALLRIPR